MLASSSFTATTAGKLWFIVHTEAPGDRCTSWYLSGQQCGPGMSTAAWQSGEKRGTLALNPHLREEQHRGFLGVLAPGF